MRWLPLSSPEQSPNCFLKYVWEGLDPASSSSLSTPDPLGSNPCISHTPHGLSFISRPWFTLSLLPGPPFPSPSFCLQIGLPYVLSAYNNLSALNPQLLRSPRFGTPIDPAVHIRAHVTLGWDQLFAYWTSRPVFLMEGILFPKECFKLHGVFQWMQWQGSLAGDAGCPAILGQSCPAENVPRPTGHEGNTSIVVNWAWKLTLLQINSVFSLAWF